MGNKFFIIVAFLILSACGGLRGAKPIELESSEVFYMSVDPLASPEIQRGQKMYAYNCSKCHGVIDESTKKDRSVGEILKAISSPKNPQMNHLQKLSQGDVELIALALSPAAQLTCDSTAPSFVNIQRLNKLEYANTFKGLFGADYNPTLNFPVESRAPYSNSAVALTVDAGLGRELFFQPVAALDKVMASDLRRNVLVCEPGVTSSVTSSVYQTIRALSYTSMSGIQDANGSAGNFNPGDYLKYNNINFGSQAPTQLKLRVAVDAAYAGGRFDIKVNCTDSQNGTTIGSLTMQSTGGWETYVERSINLTAVTGVQNLCIVAAAGPQDGIGNIRDFNLVGTQTANENLTDHRVCAQKILTDFGRKAFRRALNTAEITQFMKLYDDTRLIYPGAQEGLGTIFEESVKAPLHAILVSPQFNYRMMLLPEGQSQKSLDAFELAQRLSFFIWGSLPDKILSDLADNGAILNEVVLSMQVDRMLKDKRSSHLIDGFVMQWFGVDKLKDKSKSSTLFPEFTESLKMSMLNETRLLIQEMIQNDLSFHHLLNANSSFLNEELAKHYGINGVTSGANFTKVDMSATRRKGLLGHASMLSVTANEVESRIVHRGIFVLEHVLCEGPGSPPINVPKIESGPGPGGLPKNPRQLLENHTKNPSCATCHARIDPPGFALENFDAVGKFRTKYANGDVIDSTGKLPSGTDISSILDLTSVIARGTKYNLCASKQLLTYAMGKFLKKQELCASTKMGYLYGKATDKFSDLIKQVVLSHQFLNQARGE